MNILDLVERSVGERAIVFGSLPPEARDIDLLVPERDMEPVTRVLREARFINRGAEWILFEQCSARAVDLVTAESWSLPDEELAALFAEATPLEGYEKIARPTPHHTLLILARIIARAGGVVAPRRFARIEKALHEDSAAWDRASARAGAWGLERSLSLLEASYRTAMPAKPWRRAGAVEETSTAQGQPAVIRSAKAWRRVVAPRSKAAVVTFSGLDGCGKTSQAEALRDTLIDLGHDAVIVWAKLSRNASLRVIAAPIKAVLRKARGSSPSGTNAAAPSSKAPDPAKEVRRSSSGLTAVWASIVALANAFTQRRTTRYHLKRDRVVICDRYTLDSAVHLRYRYGTDKKFRMQSAIVRSLSPRPLRSYLLDVPGEVAHARKAEQYDVTQLQTLAQLYAEEHARLGVTRLDGTRPRAELCEEIARDVWNVLR